MDSSDPGNIEILLPFYGDPALLRECVDSVLLQSDPRWLLTVVDDGYPDPAAAQWVLTLNDPRISYYRNETNLGANATYRRALELSQGEYVIMMGADDRLRPGFIGRVRAALEPGDVDILQPGVTVIDDEGDVELPLADRVKRHLRPTSQRPDHEVILRTLMVGNWTYFPSLVWRRTRVQSHPMSHYSVVQDLALVVDLVLGGATFAIDESIEFEYRRHRKSDSSVKALNGYRFSEEAAYYRAISHELHARGHRRAARAARSHWTSRLHALLLLPTSFRPGGSPRHLLAHAVLGWR